jgi:hypothetical protein
MCCIMDAYHTTQQLSTPALVAAQDFFNPANYKGHFVKDSLSFNINFNTASGGSCPGAPGNRSMTARVYHAHRDIRPTIAYRCFVRKISLPVSDKLELQGE